MKTQTYDVAIVGAGPAGATAATLLARSERRVALFDRAAFPRRAARAAWINARVAPLLESMDVPVASILEHPFTEAVFHSADFSKTARPTFAEAPGFLIDRMAFDNVLVEAAVAAGVDLCAGSNVTGIDRLEEHVVVHVDDREAVQARLLVLAVGRGTPLPTRLGVQPGAGGAVIRSAIVEADVGVSSLTAPRVVVVLGLSREGSFAVCVGTGQRTSITLNWLRPEPDVRAVLAQVCRSLYEHEVVDVDLAQTAVKAPVFANPTSFALDMETHVGKNMLVVGDAGGFIAAASNEGIYPAMWSARIAAEVIHEALGSKHPQDTLMSFEHKWRHTMADYLRAPSTDIHLLLPLIFSNQAMADRMGAAFFSGENI